MLTRHTSEMVSDAIVAIVKERLYQEEVCDCVVA
jgi:hypothetical protein